MINQEKIDALQHALKEAKIFEEDLEEKFILGQSAGGQKINKTHSCVYLKHIPTNTVIKCQKTRSREDNRFFARRALLEKLTGVHEEKQKKIQKQKARRKRRSKNKD